MNQGAETSQINSDIHQALQLIDRLRRLLPTLRADEAKSLDENQKRVAVAAATFLWERMHKVEQSFRQAALSGVALAVSSTGAKKYRELVQAHTSEIETLLASLYEIEPDLPGLSLEELDTPVLHILMSGLDFWDSDRANGEFTQEEIRNADRFLYSDFFKPDVWLKNSDALQPILGDQADNRLNLFLREHIQELYRSFILGNHSAALALARSILEYVLIERSSSMGFDPTKDDGSTKKLSWLITDAAEAYPKLLAAMERVRDNGNMVMHPRKHKGNIRNIPSAKKKMALESIIAIRDVVETLYLH